MLSMESTSNRMSRLGKSLITDTELLSIERIIAEIDAVEAEALAELAGVLLAPERLSAAGIGPDEERFLAAVERVNPGLARAGVKVALFGRGGQGRLGARARRSRRPGTSSSSSAEARGDGRLHRARRGRGERARALEQGVPCVVGHERLGSRPRLGTRSRPSAGCRCFVAPNFAIGAVLMMRLAAEAARYLPRAEIVELHDEAQEGRAVGHGQGDGRRCSPASRRSTRCGCPASSRTRRCSSAGRASC